MEVNNCLDMARRYTKVAALQEYLPIDLFGACVDVWCPGTEEDECQETWARYRFVLAFEDGYCRDYITDKLWGAYRRLQIPVVSGGGDYSRTAIPNSYIDADNFTSMQELADFLALVDGDRDLYNSYFRWRNEYIARETPVANWCQICEALHDKSMEPQVYRDLAGWVAQDSCPLFSVSFLSLVAYTVSIYYLSTHYLSNFVEERIFLPKSPHHIPLSLYRHTRKYLMFLLDGWRTVYTQRLQATLSLCS